jgi:hypothetical protein
MSNTCSWEVARRMTIMNHQNQGVENDNIQ